MAGVKDELFDDRGAYFIDKKGNPVLTFDATIVDVRPFSEGLASILSLKGSGNPLDAKAHVIDKRGRIVGAPRFASVRRFSEGMAAVTLGDRKFGYINKAGDLVIGIRFDYAEHFSNGVAEVGIGDQIGYIDKTGKYIWNPVWSAKPATPLTGPVAPDSLVDTEFIKQTVAILKGGESDRQAKCIAQIRQAPQNYAPPVLFVLSYVLFQQGEKDEASFWFYAGQLRARFDANRCTDETATQINAIANNFFGKAINKYTFQDLENLKQIVLKVVDWDRKTPHNYEHRWINLHGIDAVVESLQGEEGPRKDPLSLPRARSFTE